MENLNIIALPVIIVPGLIFYLIQVFFIRFIMPIKVRKDFLNSAATVFFIDCISGCLTWVLFRLSNGWLIPSSPEYLKWAVPCILGSPPVVMTILTTYFLYKLEGVSYPRTFGFFIENILIGIVFAVGIIFEIVLASAFLNAKM